MQGLAFGVVPVEGRRETRRRGQNGKRVPGARKDGVRRDVAGYEALGECLLALL